MFEKPAGGRESAGRVVGNTTRATVGAMGCIVLEVHLIILALILRQRKIFE